MNARPSATADPRTRRLEPHELELLRERAARTRIHPRLLLRAAIRPRTDECPTLRMSALQLARVVEVCEGLEPDDGG